MKTKIKLVADRIIDLPQEELINLDISTISCYINIAEASYQDMIDVFPHDVFTYMEKTKKVAKTAAKSSEQYYQFFKQFVDQGYTIIHLAASSNTSSICANAIKAAQMLENVYVIDTKTLSGGIALIARHILDLINTKASVSEILTSVNQLIPKLQSSFLIDSLEALYRGGRCSGAKYLATIMLNIKPVIFLDRDGKMQVREKYRGKQEKILEKYVKTTFIKYPNPDLKQLYIIMNTPNPILRDKLIAIINKYYRFINIDVYEGSCNSSVHSGKNTIGLFYLTK